MFVFSFVMSSSHKSILFTVSFCKKKHAYYEYKIYELQKINTLFSSSLTTLMIVGRAEGNFMRHFCTRLYIGWVSSTLHRIAALAPVVITLSTVTNAHPLLFCWSRVGLGEKQEGRLVLVEVERHESSVLHTKKCQSKDRASYLPTRGKKQSARGKLERHQEGVELQEIHDPRITYFCLTGIRIYDDVFRCETEMQDRVWEAMQILQTMSNVTKYTHLSSRFCMFFQ